MGGPPPTPTPISFDGCWTAQGAFWLSAQSSVIIVQSEVADVWESRTSFRLDRASLIWLANFFGPWAICSSNSRRFDGSFWVARVLSKPNHVETY